MFVSIRSNYLEVRLDLIEKSIRYLFRRQLCWLFIS